MLTGCPSQVQIEGSRSKQTHQQSSTEQQKPASSRAPPYARSKTQPWRFHPAGLSNVCSCFLKSKKRNDAHSLVVVPSSHNIQPFVERRELLYNYLFLMLQQHCKLSKLQGIRVSSKSLCSPALYFNSSIIQKQQQQQLNPNCSSILRELGRCNTH